jgi:hypothetical protein
MKDGSLSVTFPSITGRISLAILIRRWASSDKDSWSTSPATPASRRRSSRP